MTTLLPRNTSASTRVISVAVVALLGFVLLPAPWELRALGGWDLGALVFLIWAWWVIWPADAAETKRLATREDDSRAASGFVLIGASLVSLVGVGFALILASSKAVRGTPLEGVLTLLAILTVALSWAAVHTTYSLHYAHLYYSEPEGGVDFGGDEPPDYHDFAYLAFTVGMTFQVSDTDITQRALRRSLLHHAVLSYVFGTVIVAVTINVVAGLLNSS